MLALASCGEAPALSVGPVDYAEDELIGLGPSQRQLLGDLTAFGLAVADGRAGELVEPLVRRDLRSLVLQRLALEVAAGVGGVDDATLRRRYEADPSYELDVRHLVVLSERWRPEEHRDSARARATEALERIREGGSFQAIVAEYSDEPGAEERGGLLRPGREGSWVPEFWAAASSLDEGEVSDVVETEFGFHVLRLEERRVVPFEEKRSDVLGSVVDLPTALGQTQQWAAARMRDATVDSAAIAAWREGSALSDSVLVTWPDTAAFAPLTVGRVEAYVETLRPEAAAAFQTSDSAAAIELVTSAARTHLLLERAESVGVEPPPSQEAAIRQRWRDRVARWAEALGFEPGQSPEQVGGTALEALGSMQQSAAQARSQIPALSRRLDRLYPTVIRTEAEDGP